MRLYMKYKEMYFQSSAIINEETNSSNFTLYTLAETNYKLSYYIENGSQNDYIEEAYYAQDESSCYGFISDNTSGIDIKIQNRV